MSWQNEPATPGRQAAADSAALGPQTAPGASGGTAAPAAPDPYAVPGLTDKAPGIYERLGRGILLDVVRAAAQTAGEADAIAAQFAGLLQDNGYSAGLRLNQLADRTSALAAGAGQLLACIDVVLAAACTPQAVTDRTADLRRGYCLGYQDLLRQAVGRGLPDDYTSAPLRDAQRKAAGLQRPAFAEKGATHE